jgi:L-2,4-diaminobutyric acid acetyltransferase
MQLAAQADGTPNKANDSLVLRPPRPEDGARVWQLVHETASLDDNSMYCNLLQCSHFAGTCAIAELNGAVAGWVSGYVPPEAPDTLFIWQVCVAEHARGRGLARQLIGSVLTRPACENVSNLQSTITDSNAASWALFGSLAKFLGATLGRHPHFEREGHFGGQYDTEHLVTIGPFSKGGLPVRNAA